ncbi:MAG: MotA/TolQ/ExbB proton channel family protein [Gammaproteobacteria bacterium]|nr:MotA/TolQ/ExbB proton channel family protein [Gammaproteobacteria bacterium]
MVELAALALSVALAAQQPATGPAVADPLAVDPGAQTTMDPLAVPVIDAPPVDASTPAESDLAGSPEDSTGLQEGENPYGLGALWSQGDIVSKSTLIILVIMSLASWYIMLTKLWDQSRLRKHYMETESGFWSARSLPEGLNSLTSQDNAFRAIADDGLKAAKHHEGRLTDQIPLHEWITQSLQRSVDKINNDLQGGLSFLATTGSTAPFVGLFGTVWGIYHALIAIGVAGQASIDKVAGPVGEALIMTAIGLAVAVPAVLGYNWLLRRNKALLESVQYFASDVRAYLISGSRLESGQVAAALRSR